MVVHLGVWAYAASLATASHFHPRLHGRVKDWTNQKTPSVATLVTGHFHFPQEQEPQTDRKVFPYPLHFVLYEVSEL